MSYVFRPATREQTPLIIGIAGSTKSGKTYSALRLATGLAGGGPIVMINAEGPRGHQYADTFKYLACDLGPPYRPTRYTEVLKAATQLKPAPAVIIIDSASHFHDGPGGVLEWHEEILDRMAGNDRDKRERATFAAWVEPKAAENQFIYAMLETPCAVILCLRAKQKIRILKRKVEELGWQPIVGERVAFETIFTLMLTPHCKGVPDLAISDMREPFDHMVPVGKPIDEDLGRRLAEWARGGRNRAPQPPPTPAGDDPDARSPAFDRMMDDTDADPREALLQLIAAEKAKLKKAPTSTQWARIHRAKVGVEDLAVADPALLDEFLAFLRQLVGEDAQALAEARKIATGQETL